MTNNPSTTKRRHLSLMVALFFFVISVYMLSYSGSLSFNDELQMLNITRSYADYGDSKYDLALWYVWTNYGPLGQGGPQLYPLPQAPTEPMQSLLGVPFYWLAGWTGWGVIHTAWLLNVVVGGAACVLMFRYALLLGYDLRVALFAALMLGFCSILWAYTRTFFREPFTLFILLLAAYLLELARRYGAWWWALPLAAVALVMGFYTKNSALMLLPGLLVIVMPDFPSLSGRLVVRRALDAGLIALLLLTLMLIYTPLVQRLLPQPIPVLGSYVLRSDFSQTALHSYLLSIGGSIWGTSPILLAALPGAWLLLRRQQRRYVWVMLLCLLGIAVGHALTIGQFWGGGVSWPPRFILPALPFMLLCALPVFQKAFDLGKGRRWRVWALFVAVLVLYSLWWQFASVAFSWFEYPHRLPPEAFFISEWSPGLNTLRYMRPTVLSPALLDTPLDFVWVRLNKPLWFLAFAGVALGGAGLLWAGLRGRARRWMFAALPAAYALVLAWGMGAIYPDPQYLGDRESLHQMSMIIRAEEQLDDVILLNVPDYHRFFLNNRLFNQARVVALPLPPGERGSFEEAPEVVFDDPVELLEASTPLVIGALAQERERLWLLMNSSPFFPWNIRPTEYYMATRYYLIREINTQPPDPALRLLEYATLPLAVLQANLTLNIETDLLYGEEVALLGFSLYKGAVYQAGEALPVALFWQADATPQQDYTVAFFLADSDSGVVAQGWDSAPVGGFEPTSTWSPQAIIQDNRALRLPQTTAPGEYQLWVRLYWVNAAGELEILPVRGQTVLEANIGVLPVSIRVIAPG